MKTPYSLTQRAFILAALSLSLNLTHAADPTLVGLWRFNEADGLTAKDSSGLGNDGTLYGENDNLPTRVSGQTGFGGALAFVNNGFDHSLVDIPANPMLKIGLTADDTWTLAIWANESTEGLGDHYATYGRFLSQDNGSGIQWDSGAAGDSQVYLWHGTLAVWQIGFGIGSAVAPVFDQWVHWALVYDGQNLTLYRNGNQGPWAGKSALPVHASLDWGGYSGAIQIGSQVNMTAREWHGRLDDVAVFKGALTQDQVRAIMTGDFTAYLGGAPKLATQPLDQAVNEGFEATFTVVATSETALSYQWQFNGTDLPAATNATLTVTNVHNSQAGTYTVVVRNATGFATSRGAVLTVLVPLPPRLLGLWRFDEGQGDMAHDSSGLTNHGVLATDGVVLPTWVPSRPGFGQALQFEATGDHNYVNVLANDSLRFGWSANDPWTITAWTYESSDGAGGFLSSYGRLFAQNDGFGINFNSGSSLWTDPQYYIWHHQLAAWQKGFGTDAAVVPLLDQWVHLALVYDGKNLTLYRNGNQNQGVKTSLPVTAGLEWSGYNSSLQIGTMLNMGGDHNWNGRIDDFAVFSGALTEAQLQTVMNGEFSMFDNTTPLLTLNRSGSQVVVSWTYGVLQSSGTLAGGWQDLTDTHSPLILSATDAQRFYRVRR